MCRLNTGTEVIKFGFTAKQVKNVRESLWKVPNHVVSLFCSLKWNFNNYPPHKCSVVLCWGMIAKGSVISWQKNVVHIIITMICEHLCKYICVPRWFISDVGWNLDVSKSLHLNCSSIVSTMDWQSYSYLLQTSLLYNLDSCLILNQDQTGKTPVKIHPVICNKDATEQNILRRGTLKSQEATLL